MRQNQKRKAKNERELCNVKNEFQKKRKELERQISQLKEKYKKDRREVKSKCKKIKQEKKDKQKVRDHLIDTLPQRIEDERTQWRQNFLRTNNPSYREQENELERAS